MGVKLDYFLCGERYSRMIFYDYAAVFWQTYEFSSLYLTSEKTSDVFCYCLKSGIYLVARRTPRTDLWRRVGCSNRCDTVNLVWQIDLLQLVRLVIQSVELITQLSCRVLECSDSLFAGCVFKSNTRLKICQIFQASVCACDFQVVFTR